MVQLFSTIQQKASWCIAIRATANRTQVKATFLASLFIHFFFFFFVAKKQFEYFG
jgi:hypothetical protein